MTTTLAAPVEQAEFSPPQFWAAREVSRTEQDFDVNFVVEREVGLDGEKKDFWVAKALGSGTPGYGPTPLDAVAGALHLVHACLRFARAGGVTPKTWFTRSKKFAPPTLTERAREREFSSYGYESERTATGFLYRGSYFVRK